MSLTVLLLYFFLFGHSNAANDGNCKITQIRDSQWDSLFSFPINDGQTEEEIFESTYEGNLEITSCSHQYFDITNNATRFLIKTNKNFANFDNDTAKQQTLFKTIPIFSCQMNCNDGTSTLQIAVTVTDVNNHPPTFTSLDSEYRVAFPIMPYTDFTVYGNPVVAEDIDFSNQNVVFTIAPPDDDDFEITTISNENSKRYTAVFKAKRIIQINGTKEYTITATDSGTNPGTLSTSQTFTLTTDPSSSLDTPTFQATSYSFDYSVTGETCSISPREGPIAITTNKPEDINKHLTITGDYTDHFQPVFDASTKTVTISCLSPISPITSPIAVLYLRVETDAITTVPVVLYLGDVVADGPSFSSHVYTADYDDTDASVKLTEDIVVSPDEAKVNISGSAGTIDFTQYFTLEKTSTGYMVKARSLPEDVLRRQRSVVFTIAAYLGTAKTYSALVINLPVIDRSPAIQFGQVLYNGEYRVVDGTVKFTTDRIDILTEEEDGNVSVSISKASSYGTYFDASYKSKVVTITEKGLPEDILNKTAVIPLTLEAAISGAKEKSALAVLNIKIFYNNSEVDTRYLRFNNLLYNGTYKAKDNHSIVTDEVIIDTDQTDDNIEISINNEYNEYFNATYSGRKVTIALSQPVPPAILQSVRVIPILLMAKIKSTTHSSQAILNLKVDDGNGNKGQLSLSSFVYNGKYIVEGDKVRIEYDPITVITDQEDNKIDVEITNGYEQDFKATYSNKAVLVSLLVDSPNETLSSLANIPVGIKVKIRNSSIEAQAVLNLRVIGDETKGKLSLSSFVYNGKYIVEGGKVRIEYDPITVITDQEDNKIDVEITNGYEKDFNATYSNKTVVVSLLVDSPNESLLSLSNIPVGIKVKIRNSTVEAQAVLNLRVIGDDNTGVLSLSSFVYNGKYKVEDDKVSIEHDPINVTTDQEDDKITVEITNGYEKDFKATYSNKRVQVSLLMDSPSETLLSLANIPVGIKVNIRNSTTEAQAVLNFRVIGVPDKNDTRTLAFSTLLYAGKYSISEGESEGHFEIEDLELRTNLMVNEIEITLSNEHGYQKYFDVTNTNRLVSVKLKGGVLPENIVKNTRFIPMTVTAKIIATGDSSNAVLNIDIDYDHDNDDETKTHHHSVTGYIVAIVVLTILLLGLIGGSAGFYFWKIKGKSYEKMLDSDSNKVTFERRTSKQSIGKERKGSTALEERRPTGFVFRKFDEDGTEISEDPPAVEMIEPRKSVAFDDKIEKLEIDSIDTTIDDEDIEKALDDETDDNKDTVVAQNDVLVKNRDFL